MIWNGEEEEKSGSILDGFDPPSMMIEVTLNDGGDKELHYRQIHVNLQEIEHWLKKITGRDYESFRVEARTDGSS